MAAIGVIEGPAVYFQHDHTKQLTFFFPLDWSGSSWFFRAWQYTGASLNINRVASSATYDAGTGLTKVLFNLTAVDTAVSWSLGRYTVYNNTQDRAFMTGDAVVERVPTT